MFKKIEEKLKSKNDKNKSDKPDIVLIVLIVILVIVVIILIISKVKNIGVLDNDDELVTELHEYFSTDNLENCEGLFNYADKKVDYQSISSEDKLCIAYHKAEIKGAETEVYEKESDGKTCKVDGMVFNTDEDGGSSCTVSIIDRKYVDNTYKKLFGHTIENNESFRYDGYHVCFLKGDKYYCGLAETYKVTIGTDVTVFRGISRAEKKGDTITIYDYFAKVVGDECYKNYTTQNVNLLCRRNLTGKDFEYKELEKYGIKYKHVYKKASDDTYYWVSSEPVEDPNEK